eukprot:m.604828 g.604828  ORF g.604828 m.604828 type:complete len:166 (+) comp22462_c0_seq15:333-830(+)
MVSLVCFSSKIKLVCCDNVCALRQAFLNEATPRAVLHREATAPSGPSKSLFGMQKVYLQPNEWKVLTFSTSVLPPLVLAQSDGKLLHQDSVPEQSSWCTFCTTTAQGRRVIAPGHYDIIIGGDGASGIGGDVVRRNSEVRARIALVTPNNAILGAPLVRMHGQYY